MKTCLWLGCEKPVKQDFEHEDPMEAAWAKAMEEYCQEHRDYLNSLPMWSLERIRVLLNLGLD
jgi:hypothetical protein